MRLYNTLTRTKEEFIPLEEGKVKMYVCGPTVYDFMHIGNARPYVIFDTVRRYFEYRGYEVNYVQNFTDVDDKIIKRANKENVDMNVISERFIKEAIIDADSLNVKRATRNPRVTEEMDEIIEMIATLIEKGYAYENKGTVYFDTKKYKEYGKLSRKNIDDLESGSRVEVDIEKKNPVDFVLWKPCKPLEPKWESPWGDGRPGWHIECSVMAKKYLGETIDIHAGGEDLVFPHHENEIAQSEAANSKTFARYWMHNGFINIDNQKMSKSKGNFFTIREIIEKFSSDVIRFFILSGHYRTPINFSEELIQSSKNSLERINTCVKNLEFTIENGNKNTITELEKDLLNQSNQFKLDLEKAMDDDFNTADAITAIFEFVRFANSNVNENSSSEFVQNILDGIIELADILGINIKKNNKGVDEAEIEKLINDRKIARENKDFKTSDKIRDELAEKGIVIEDTPLGVRWSYKG